MRRLYFYLFIIFFSIAADGCVDEFDVPLTTQEPRLVVDGMITDQEGPYTVKLSLSSNLDQDLDNALPVSSASVTIYDDRGNFELLKEEPKGTYTTAANGLRGIVGRKYQLKIKTSDGKEYESQEAELRTAGKIDDVFFEFEPNSINQNDIGQPQDAFAVYINASGESSSSNLFRWRWRGIYHVRTFPELRTRIEGDGRDVVEVPDPMPCSGYIVEEGVLFPVAPCVCCDCYVTEYSNDAYVSDSRFINGNRFLSVPIAQIPVEGFYFYDRYYIEVEQLSLQESVYDFWRLVQVQQESAGDIFQPNIVKIKGNIQCTSNPDEEVFGIFAVSASVKKSTFIKRSDIPSYRPVLDTLTVDCRAQFANSTNVKPPFW